MESALGNQRRVRHSTGWLKSQSSRNLLKNPARQRRLSFRIAESCPLQAFRRLDCRLGGGAAC